MSNLTTGTVKWFNDAKGFGFISGDNGNEVFAHYSQIMSNGFKTLIEGQRVQFSVSKSQRGFQASEIIAIDN
ncbi:cold-shock protein [Acinetobacter cumulans]|jgi:CspA family cold shock protein|uniref:Cold-shock protein n=2 Tax=Acinetobacter TaxID=469 RepID=A0A3A8FLS0_9GAMM|nr:MULTISPECIES: cold-shock protein [Acinetobacter]MBI1452859.1 cold-shock protein [Acinetobacter sp. FL51]RKG47418.1 cold-shock protein [Acinetobacter cumulans]RKG50371.1 cold-shock protein [Acinetobacter cumulans]RLL17254.1 cold-shock protein [Acinetobacter chengduensis]